MTVNILLFIANVLQYNRKNKKSGHKTKCVLICLSEEEFGTKGSIKNARSRKQLSIWCQVSKKYTVSIFRIEGTNQNKL
jgi:hypothetical protein